MKGILLAGGAGTRLYPMTRVASNNSSRSMTSRWCTTAFHTLLAGVREILVISTPDDAAFREFLGGRGPSAIPQLRAGLSRGIAQAFLLAEEFLAGRGVILILR